MTHNYRLARPTLGILAGWQFYRTATTSAISRRFFVVLAGRQRNWNVIYCWDVGSVLLASLTDPLRPAWPYYSTEHDFVPIGPWNTDGFDIVAKSTSFQKTIRLYPGSDRYRGSYPDLLDQVNLGQQLLPITPAASLKRSITWLIMVIRRLPLSLEPWKILKETPAIVYGPSNLAVKYMAWINMLA